MTNLILPKPLGNGSYYFNFVNEETEAEVTEQSDHTEVESLD